VRRDAIRTDGRIAGVNVGGTTTSVVLGTTDGTILNRHAWPTQSRDGEALFAAIVSAIAGVAPDASAIGVAIGGPMDMRTGTLIAPVHLPGMNGFPLLARLRDTFASPVTVHHDAAACALAEYRWGADRGADGRQSPAALDVTSRSAPSGCGERVAAWGTRSAICHGVSRLRGRAPR